MKTLKTFVLAVMFSLFVVNNLSGDSPKSTSSWQFSFTDANFMCINEPVTVDYWGTTTAIILSKKNLFIYHGKVKVTMVGELTGKLYEARSVYNNSYQLELDGSQSSKSEETFSIWNDGKFIGLYHFVQHVIFTPDGQFEVTLDNYHSDCK
jgi:hypothetical protein